MPSTDVTEVTLLGGSVTVEAPAALPGATHVDAPSLPSSEEPDSDDEAVDQQAACDAFDSG
jgi:hypothetical protein